MIKTSADLSTSDMFCIFSVAVKDVSSKHSKISGTVVNFQGNILIFKELRVPLK